MNKNLRNSAWQKLWSFATRSSSYDQSFLLSWFSVLLPNPVRTGQQWQPIRVSQDRKWYS